MWESIRVKDACLGTTNFDPRRRPGDPFFYVDVSCVSDNSYQIVETRQVFGRDAPSRARKVIQADDVIFATVRPTLRRVALVPARLDGQVCSTGFCVLRANRSILEPLYLYFYLLTEGVRKNVAALEKGATYPAINDSDLLETRMRLPPLPEQRAIARVLRAVQEAKEARQRELALERERKAALMDFLFTHGTRGETTKQTEIGQMPQSWPVLRLAEVTDIAYGVQAAVAHLLDSSSGIPILTNLNITNEGTMDLSTLRYYLLPDKKKDLLLRKGDVLFNWRSGSQHHVGKTALFSMDGDFTFSSFILRLRTTRAVNSVFLFYYLLAIKARGFFMRNRQQSSINSVFNASITALIPIPIPDESEQTRISELLTSCTAKVSALEREIALLDELFRAALEELMAGRLSAVPLIEQEVPA